MAVAQHLPAGTSVELHVDAPQLWEPLALPGQVAWSRVVGEDHCELGLRFEHDSSEAVAILVELMGSGDFE